MSSIGNWQERIEISHDRDPRTHRFGFYARDDNSLASIGMFQWFATKEELIQSVVKDTPAIHQDPDEEESSYSTVVRELGDLLKDGGAVTLDASVLAGVNKILQGDTLVVWWGDFDELSQGQSEWSREMRLDWRESNAEEDLDNTAAEKPIQPEEEDDFVDMLNSYGH